MKNVLILTLLPWVLFSAERYELQKYTDIINTTFKEHNEIYTSTDSCKEELYVPHDSAYTYATPGGIWFNVGAHFERMRINPLMTWRSPGTFKIANGIVNRPNGLQYAFNWRLEAIRNIQNLKYMLENNEPVECWQTICYGFFSLSSTIYALLSPDPEAVALRTKHLSLSTNDIDKIFYSWKLCIVSSPLIDSTRMLDEQYNPLIEEVIINTSCFAPLISNTLSNFGLYNYHKSFDILWSRASNKIASSLSFSALKYLTSLDEKAGKGLELLSNLPKQKIIVPSTLLVNWQRKDGTSGTVKSDDLKILSTSFANIIGIGSPFEQHVIDDTRQKLIANTIRAELNLPHYSNKELLNHGKEYMNRIKPFIQAQDWQGLKRYTENKDEYIKDMKIFYKKT